MSNSLTIIGGTYLEKCQDPLIDDLFGSGLRAAIALSKKEINLTFKSCFGRRELEIAENICEYYNIKSDFTMSDSTITFAYYHPLSKPTPYPYDEQKPLVNLGNCEHDRVLYYGLLEATTQVHANYLVYDPQNHVSFKETGSSANHLALIMNSYEAYKISGLSKTLDLEDVGHSILKSEGAEVVVIKNGSSGAIVVEDSKTTYIPVFKTERVFPIGSGDIFSATFAWKWLIEQLNPAEAALEASKYTADFCNSRVLPLSAIPEVFEVIEKKKVPNRIYLAGPFFSTADRWLVSEVRRCLVLFGNHVFSPFHEIGPGDDIEVCSQDLKAIQCSDVVFALGDNLDAGTMFEIGYARALGKNVIVLAENVKKIDLTMLIGSGCEIVSDLSTAIYKASW